MPTRPDAVGKATYDDGKVESPNRFMKPFRKRTAPDSDPVETDEESAPEDEATGTDAESKEPKKRSRFWPAPRKLPEEGDADAKKLDAAESSGHSKL
jgi:hypothetical protein